MSQRSWCTLQAQAEGQKYQIEALTAQLEHLTASKSQLESRCQLLEKVVKMREDPALSSPQVRRARLPSPLRSEGCTSLYSALTPQFMLCCRLWRRVAGLHKESAPSSSQGCRHFADCISWSIFGAGACRHTPIAVVVGACN